MTNIILFNFENNDIRFVGTAENPEWIADDVCKSLDLDNTSKALETLDPDEKGITFSDTLGIAVPQLVSHELISQDNSNREVKTYMGAGSNLVKWHTAISKL